MYEFLDRRYAQALYDACKATGNLEETLKDLESIVESMKENEEFKQIIEHPQIHKLEKKAIFKKVFENEINEELLSFLLLLIEKDRISYLKEKYNQFRLIYFEEHNMIEVEVRTAISLTDEQRTSLKENLENKYNKQIVLLEKIDKTLIGGIIIKAGDDVIDSSIKTKLEVMKNIMVNKEQHKIDVEIQKEPLLVKVKTVQPLTKIQKEKLKGKLHKYYDSDFIIEETIDTEILGGVYITVGDDILDYTLKGRLKDLKTSTVLKVLN